MTGRSAGCLCLVVFSAGFVACAGQVGRDPGDGEDADEANGDETGDSRSGETIAQGRDPGTVAMRRLNATEYNNTVRDLLGTSLLPANDFGVRDKAAFGFDNNANALDVDLANLEDYAGAAEALASEALTDAKLKARLLVCDPTTGDECVRQIVEHFVRRAYRRPVEDAELALLIGLVDVARAQGDGIEVGLQLVLQAVLSSPHFLYRIEVDAEPDSDKPHAVSSHELASRLSYFLWSSMPDDELFQAADDDRLGESAALSRQVERMLADEKARGLVQGYGDLWLPNRIFAEHEVDTGVFPNWKPELRTAMLDETRALLMDLFQGAITYRELLTADYTYVNDALARHYGLPAPGSGEAVRVATGPDSHRRGVLTHGSVLAATSQPGVTSIVKRGRFVFEDLMCGEVPEPQDGVPAFDTSGAGTLREKFERHRADPQCRACHLAIDPPGFVLESYDAVGAYRETDNEAPIDRTGEVDIDGEKILVANAMELGERVAGSEGYTRCVSEGLYTFALGRGPVPHDGGGDMDEAVLARLRAVMDDTGGDVPTLVRTIVAAKPFKTRRANPGLTGGKP